MIDLINGQYASPRPFPVGLSRRASETQPHNPSQKALGQRLGKFIALKLNIRRFGHGAIFKNMASVSLAAYLLIGHGQETGSFHV